MNKMKSDINEKNSKEVLKNLERYKNINFQKTDLISILAIIMFEKTYFNKNKELELFIKEIVGFEYLEYVLKSRTLFFSRVSKDLYFLNEKKCEEIYFNIFNYFNHGKDLDKKNQKKSKYNANEKLDAWLKGIK